MIDGLWAIGASMVIGYFFILFLRWLFHV
jgi:hypothetical protein